MHSLEEKKWIGTWIFSAFHWAQTEGTEQHRQNCLALLEKVMPEKFGKVEALPAKEVWKKFIDHLDRTQPLGRPDKNGKTIPHQNFIGSIDSYRKVFIDAQSPEGDKRQT
jgi:hypothetical protein